MKFTHWLTACPILSACKVTGWHSAIRQGCKNLGSSNDGISAEIDGCEYNGKGPYAEEYPLLD